MAFEALQKAIYEDDKSTVIKLLKKSEVTQQLGSLFGEKKTTVLHEACKHGQTDIVKQLINAGSDVGQEGYNGWIPLHKAAAWGHPRCVEVVLKNNAADYVNVPTYAQSTALHLAAEKTRVIYHKQIVKDDGVDLKEIHKQYREVVTVLLHHGAVVDARNYAGRTPLHNCAVEGYIDIAYILLEHKADTEVRDNKGKTALDVARGNHHYDMVEWFLEMEIKEERLARQDLARLAAAEHEKLENRLVELVEEHDAELAEQKAQLQQAYKLDIEGHTEEIRQRLLEEMAERENVIAQLNSLVKAERQNMDNDHLGYQKYSTYLLASLTKFREEGQVQNKVIEDLRVQLEEKSDQCKEQEARLEAMSADLQTVQTQSKLDVEEHTAELERVSAGFKQNILLLQQMVDNLNVDLSTQLGLNEEKENTLAALQNNFSEQVKRNTELVEQTEQLQDKVTEQEQLVLMLRQEKEKEQEVLQTQQEELSVVREQEDTLVEQHQQEIEQLKAQYEKTIKTSGDELAGIKKTMLIMKSQEEQLTKQLSSCESKYETQIQTLQKTLQEQELAVESVRKEAQKEGQKQQELHSCELQQVQTEQKQKLSSLQQSLTEKEKQFLVVSSQLKSQSEQMKVFEKSEQELQHKHQTELKQMEEKLGQQHQSNMQIYKAELMKNHESEIARVKRDLDETYKSSLRAQEENLVQRHKQEKTQLQEMYAQKQSTLQQEMFRVAGAEQAKLKEQYEGRIQEIQTKNDIALHELNKKLEAENGKCRELTSQQQETQKILEEAQRKLETETKKHSQLVLQMKSEQQEKLTQYKQQIRTLESDLSNAKLLQRQMEHETKRFQTRQEELARQSEEKVHSVQQTAEGEKATLKAELDGKNSEIEAKLSELKKQDAVIKSYVIENTKLKDEYTAKSSNMEGKCDHLKQEVSELKQLLSSSTADLDEMKKKFEAEHLELEGLSHRYSEDMKASEENWTTKIHNMEQLCRIGQSYYTVISLGDIEASFKSILLLNKENELSEVQEQLNSLNEKSEDAQTKDIFTLQENRRDDNTEVAYAEQDKINDEQPGDENEKEE